MLCCIAHGQFHLIPATFSEWDEKLISTVAHYRNPLHDAIVVPVNVYWLHNCITSIFSATPSMYVWKRQIKKPTHFVLGEENWSWLQLCVLKGQIQRDQIASTMNTYISVSHQHFIQTIQFHFSHNYVRLLPWHSHLHHILTRTTSTMFRRTNSNHGQ